MMKKLLSDAVLLAYIVTMLSYALQYACSCTAIQGWLKNMVSF